MGEAVVHIQDAAVKRINAYLGRLTKKLGQGYSEHDYPWIVFLLKNTEYAANAKHVMRVAVLYEIVPFADAPAYCPGVIWDHGGMIRLLDLRALLGQGDYLSALKNKNGSLPVIIVIGLDGKRRGIIVDEIVAVRYLGPLAEATANQNTARIIKPESLRAVKFENADTKIAWSKRADIELMLKAETAERSGIWESKF